MTEGGWEKSVVWDRIIVLGGVSSREPLAKL